MFNWWTVFFWLLKRNRNRWKPDWAPGWARRNGIVEPVTLGPEGWPPRLMPSAVTMQGGMQAKRCKKSKNHMLYHALICKVPMDMLYMDHMYVCNTRLICKYVGCLSNSGFAQPGMERLLLRGFFGLCLCWKGSTTRRVRLSNYNSYNLGFWTDCWNTSTHINDTEAELHQIGLLSKSI